jgi:DNA-binding transcriptional regulator YhcF (GntR family)
MKEGFLKLSRNLKYHWLWIGNNKKFSKLEAWIDILYRANFKKGNKIEVENRIIEQRRGEFITSQLQLAKAWNWNVKTVNKFLKLLEKDSMITYKTNNHFTTIFVENYEKYNPETKPHGEQKGQHTESDIHNKGIVSGEGGDTINKDKKENKAKKENLLSFDNNKNNFTNSNKKQKHIEIINKYAEWRQINFENKDQYNSFVKRNVRAAKDLLGYELNKIIQTMEYLNENADYKWTLETVGKFIDENFNKLKEKEQSEDTFIDNYLNK